MVMSPPECAGLLGPPRVVEGSQEPGDLAELLGLSERTSPHGTQCQQGRADTVCVLGRRSWLPGATEGCVTLPLASSRPVPDAPTPRRPTTR